MRSPTPGPPVREPHSNARARSRRLTWHDCVVIVDAAWYVDGKRTLETDSIADLAAARWRGGFGWLGLRMPTDERAERGGQGVRHPGAGDRRRPAQARPPEGRAARRLPAHRRPARPATSTRARRSSSASCSSTSAATTSSRCATGRRRRCKACAPSCEHHPDVLQPRPRRRAPGGAAARRRVVHAGRRRARERRPRGRARRVQRDARPADAAHLLPDPRGPRLPHRARAAVPAVEAAHRTGVPAVGASRDRRRCSATSTRRCPRSSSAAARSTSC